MAEATQPVPSASRGRNATLVRQLGEHEAAVALVLNGAARVRTIGQQRSVLTRMPRGPRP